MSALPRLWRLATSNETTYMLFLYVLRVAPSAAAFLILRRTANVHSVQEIFILPCRGLFICQYNFYAKCQYTYIRTDSNNKRNLIPNLTSTKTNNKHYKSTCFHTSLSTLDQGVVTIVSSVAITLASFYRMKFNCCIDNTKILEHDGFC